MANGFALAQSGPMLMHNPTVSATTIAFSYAGDLWTVPRSGGRAIRITSSPGVESKPFFSPDGTQIAFTGEYDGNVDVYVMPAEGGAPKRLTFHAGGDSTAGWTPDGKRVLFISGRGGVPVPQMYSVPADGGASTQLPFPIGQMPSMSADGKQIAYVPCFQFQRAWKRYRGGETYRIWVASLSDSKPTELPRANSNDQQPMWIGNSIYFISDRKGATGIYSYDLASKRTVERLAGDGFDIKSASYGAGAIVYEKLGSIGLYDVATGLNRVVPIDVTGDFPEIRPRFVDVATWMQSGAISPSGARVVLEARGHIVTVPASKGTAKDLTPEDGVAHRMPDWSPDAKAIAYFSDASGEYELVVQDASTEAKKSFKLGNPSAFPLMLRWSPDSKSLCYTDNHHDLWIIDAATGTNTKVDTAPYEDPTRQVAPSWSPDSKWLAFHRDLDSHVNAIFLYDVVGKKVHQITDGLSHARFPAFDKSGKYLYFAASTNIGPALGWLDLSSNTTLNTLSSVYAVLLRKDLSDPLAPQSDDENPTPPKPDGAFQVDLDGIGQRIVSLPVMPRNVMDMRAGPDGSVFVLSMAPVSMPSDQPSVTLSKFDFAMRRAIPFAAGVSGFDVTPKGDKVLLMQGPLVSIVSAMAPPEPGQGAVNLEGIHVKIDPRKEWRQMFNEVWRIEREYFYAPNFHGQDLGKLKTRYEPFLNQLTTRADLNYLFEDMLGELTIGHMFIQGGDIPTASAIPGGLLGADYAIENNRYRLKRVYSGELWNPGARGPLARAGVNAVAGEYILAINGRSLTAQDDLDERLEFQAGKQVKIKIGPNPTEVGSREVVVVPTGSEQALRLLAWAEDNRRKVSELSGGKLGYAWIPDTNVGGWTNFLRYYYAQTDKAGMVIDERYNGGGQADDYMVEMMKREVNSAQMSRYGKDQTSPLAQVYGPKSLLINEYAGSGGDYFPWHFREAKVGPLIGKRTWGGLVGILRFPTLVDGGAVTAPNIALYDPRKGEFIAENTGVAPDIDVEWDPVLWRQGRDSQLERAVAETMKMLAAAKPNNFKRPSYPDKSKVPPSS